MNEQLEDRNTEVQDVADEIGDTAKVAYDLLLERREAALSAAVEPLEAEKESLAHERVAIEEARVSLEQLLPAQARVAQAEADKLTVSGHREAAQVKLEEAQKAANAPAAMTERQREISARIEEIDGEKKAVAKRIFETWYAELQQVVRASEHGLFIELLDKSRDEMYAYQNRHGLHGTLDRPYSFLVKTSHLQNLTAPERSQEWTAGNRWYSAGGS